MSRVAGSFVDNAIAGNIPVTDYPEQPGEWQIRATEAGDRRIVFGCPLRPGQVCGVYIKPHSYESQHGAKAWTWDGDTTAPTLSPSINCINDPPASCGCGWHGYVDKGVIA